MRIGLSGSPAVAAPDLARTVDAALAAAEQGFHSYWLAQPVWNPPSAALDALTVFAVVGTRAPRLELGVAVIPVWFRHPFALASQLITTELATRNRVTLGLGAGHRPVMEAGFGVEWKPVDQMRDYLAILDPLLTTGTVSYRGSRLSADATFAMPDELAPPMVLLAALGPRMLRLAGERAAGTVLFLVGERTIGGLVAPTLTAAAAGAGRPAPRIACMLPICVSSTPDAARERAARAFAAHSRLPSYREALSREGVKGVGDLAVVGSERTVRARLAAIADAGATDFIAWEFTETEQERTSTRELLRSMLE